MSIFSVTAVAAATQLGLIALLYPVLRYRRRSRSMLWYAAAPSLLFFLALVLVWLIVPLFVVPPLSVYCAFKCYRNTVAAFRDYPVMARLGGALPMAVALATFPAISELIQGAYRA